MSPREEIREIIKELYQKLKECETDECKDYIIQQLDYFETLLDD